jgi:hypothetical protein
MYANALTKGEIVQAAKGIRAALWETYAMFVVIPDPWCDLPDRLA